MATVPTVLARARDVNATCVGDFTPLRLAAMRGHLDTADKLVELGSCVWARDWMFRTPLQVADYWNQTEVVRRLGSAMCLCNDPSVEVCGGWWHRHVEAFDMALNASYHCWCSVCHCPCPHGEKDLEFLAIKYGLHSALTLRRRREVTGGGEDARAAGATEAMRPQEDRSKQAKFGVQDDLEMLTPDGLDYRHVTRLHPIYNATWNARAKATWLERQQQQPTQHLHRPSSLFFRPASALLRASALSF